MLKSLLDLELFTFGDIVINLGSIIGFTLLLLASIFLYKKVIKIYLPKFYKFFNISKIEGSDFNSLLRNIIILMGLLIFIKTIQWDFVFYHSDKSLISVRLIIKILLIYEIGKMIIWGVDNIIHSFYLSRKVNTKEEELHDRKKEHAIIGVIRNIVYLSLATIVLSITNLNFRYTAGADTPSLTDDFNISIVKILIAILIIFIARFMIWLLTQFILFKIYDKKQIPFAQRYAINQLILYVIYVFAIFLALHYVLGSNMSVIYGGAAALLVGVGLGLQQTFNDFFSGLVLLFERSVGVGDIIEVEQKIGKVKKIGMRSSLIQTRDATTIVVPNSKMVNLNIQNISHEYPLTRYDVLVSVAYGTDTTLVKSLLLESLKENDKVTKHPEASVQFANFGADGLDFRLLFYTKELFQVEQVKSDIRFKIDELFKANKITIPFPQRTIWMKKED